MLEKKVSELEQVVVGKIKESTRIEHLRRVFFTAQLIYVLILFCILATVGCLRAGGRCNFCLFSHLSNSFSLPSAKCKKLFLKIYREKLI